MAARSWRALYDFMREHEMPRAPIALWSVGRYLGELPGREQEAIRALRRFLDESTPFTEDAEVRDFRSEAVALIDELEARADLPDDDEAQEGTDDAETAPVHTEEREPDDEDGERGGGISPVGPVLLAVGGGALLTGVIVGAISLGQASSVTSKCGDPNACPPSLRPEYQQMRDFSAAADATLVAGAAVAVLGLILTFTLETGGAEQPDVTAACSADGCGAIVGGRF